MPDVPIEGGDCAETEIAKSGFGAAIVSVTFTEWLGTPDADPVTVTV